MAIRKVTWDNGHSTSGSITVDFARNSTVPDENGVDRTIDEARYANPRLLCGAPAISGVQAGTSQNRVWGGRWRNSSNPQSCMVQFWRRTSDDAYFVSIHVNGYNDPPNGPSFRRKNITGTTTHKLGRPDLIAPGTEDEIRQEPWCFIIGDGMIFACCETLRYISGVWKSASCAICWWNETSDSSSGGWEVIAQLDDVQVDGRQHGAAWMATGPWVPGDRDDSDPLTEFFIAWTDYRGQSSGPGDKESALGGNLCIVRATRNTASGQWVPGNNVVLYREAVNNDGRSQSSGTVGNMTPTSVLAGDQNGANIESALHFCWYFVDGAIPVTPTSYFQNLTFI